MTGKFTFQWWSVSEMSPQGKKETFNIQARKDNGSECAEKSHSLRLRHELETILPVPYCFTLTALPKEARKRRVAQREGGGRGPCKVSCVNNHRWRLGSDSFWITRCCITCSIWVWLPKTPGDCPDCILNAAPEDPGKQAFITLRLQDKRVLSVEWWGDALGIGS